MYVNIYKHTRTKKLAEREKKIRPCPFMKKARVLGLKSGCLQLLSQEEKKKKKNLTNLILTQDCKRVPGFAGMNFTAALKHSGSVRGVYGLFHCKLKGLLDVGGTTLKVIFVPFSTTPLVPPPPTSAPPCHPRPLYIYILSPLIYMYVLVKLEIKITVTITIIIVVLLILVLFCFLCKDVVNIN